MEDYNQAFIDCIIDEAPIFLLVAVYPDFEKHSREEQVSILRERYVSNGCASYGISFNPRYYRAYELVMYCNGM